MPKQWQPGHGAFRATLAHGTMDRARHVQRARVLSIVTRPQQVFFALLVSLTWLLRQDSFGGGGGLFIEYFSHSEIGNGLFLLDLYLAFRQRIAAAITVVGAIFFVNAFMGVWAIVVLAVVFVAQIAHGDMTGARILYRCAIGIAMPVYLPHR
jgi:hypothetical protein